MKVIFLDIDWVLIRFWNTDRIRKTRSEKWKSWLITDLDEDLVINLIEIIKQTWAHIVISSSWRRSKVLMDVLRSQMREFRWKDGNWCEIDLYLRVIGVTPHWLWYWRWNEVLTYIMNRHKSKLSTIENWVMIDDDSFDSKCVNRLWKFVHTKTSQWLTIEKMKEAINILNN